MGTAERSRSGARIRRPLVCRPWIRRAAGRGELEFREEGPFMAIGGVVLKKIAIIEDERGYLFEAIRSDDNHFMGFGQVYFVKCNPRSSRGGHYHLRHWDF